MITREMIEKLIEASILIEEEGVAGESKARKILGDELCALALVIFDIVKRKMGEREYPDKGDIRNGVLAVLRQVGLTNKAEFVFP